MTNREVAGIQHLDARLVVAVERRHCARTSGVDRVCGVGKPHPEVVRLDWARTWIQDEGLSTEDPGHVHHTFAISIRC